GTPAAAGIYAFGQFGSTGNASAAYHSGTITVSGEISTGITAVSYGTGSAELTTDAGTTINVSQGAGATDQAALIVGTLSGSLAEGDSVTANIASTITNTGPETFAGAHPYHAPLGILAFSDLDAPITLNYTGPSITTSGARGIGIVAVAGTGDVTVTS